MASFNPPTLQIPEAGWRLSPAFPRRLGLPSLVGAQRRTLQATAVVKFQGTRMREERLSRMIEEKVLEAMKVCDGDEMSDECKVAWDEVEEVSQAKADLRRKMEKQDPLESFCQENAETEECVICEDIF